MKWLQGMFVPTLALWLVMIGFGVASGMNPDRPVSPHATTIGRAAFSIGVAAWVMADARKRGRRLCYDYDLFLFFAWSVMAPVYLFQTRGPRAMLTLLCFGGLYLLMTGVAIVVGLVAMWLRGDLIQQ